MLNHFAESFLVHPCEFHFQVGLGSVRTILSGKQWDGEKFQTEGN